MTHYVIVLMAISILAVGCAAQTRLPNRSASALDAQLEDDWKYWMTQHPEMATVFGYPGKNMRWTDYSAAAIDGRTDYLKNSLVRLKAINRNELDSKDQVNYDLYQDLLETAVKGLEFHNDAVPIKGVNPHNLMMPVNQMEGVQQDIPRTFAMMPSETREDYENIILRLANTYKLEARPKWEMEALTLHEAVPGHHIQVSIAQEFEGLPNFRKNSSYTAFVEGWGLYAESLGEEMGFYKDPYSKFGQLTYQMWRAIRLVVDTGLHSMGWTRDQAIHFFRENAAKTDQDIIVEVDRYIVWPGQALGYKMGQLKIQELRTRAARQLGSRFDIRQFHDIVLGQGAVPMDLLEQQVNAWIQSALK